MDDDRPLTEEQLAKRRRELSLLHESHVAREYREAWKECMLECDRPPKAAAIQSLVTAWKVLWRWHRRKL